MECHNIKYILNVDESFDLINVEGNEDNIIVRECLQQRYDSD